MAQAKMPAYLTAQQPGSCHSLSPATSNSEKDESLLGDISINNHESEVTDQAQGGGQSQAEETVSVNTDMFYTILQQQQEMMKISLYKQTKKGKQRGLI